MDRIIAGRFLTKDDADAAATTLAPFVDATDISIFHNNPPGQHDVLEKGGDEEADPGAKDAGSSATSTAVAAGLTAGAVGSLAGPVVGLAAAGVGAYLGSLAGAMDGMEDASKKPKGPERRPGGVILSARIADPANEQRVIETLRAHGAMDIEQAQGEWRDGDWADFNPVAKPKMVENKGARK
jgi:hypothetical protein